MITQFGGSAPYTQIQALDGYMDSIQPMIKNRIEILLDLDSGLISIVEDGEKIIDWHEGNGKNCIFH